MKKLFIVIALLGSSYFASAQTDTLNFTFKFKLKEVQTLLDALGEVKLKDGIQLYMKLVNETQNEVNAASIRSQVDATEKAEAAKKKADAAKKEEPKKEAPKK